MVSHGQRQEILMRLPGDMFVPIPVKPCDKNLFESMKILQVVRASRMTLVFGKIWTSKGQIQAIKCVLI